MPPVTPGVLSDAMKALRQFDEGRHERGPAVAGPRLAGLLPGDPDGAAAELGVAVLVDQVIATQQVSDCPLRTVWLSGVRVPVRSSIA